MKSYYSVAIGAFIRERYRRIKNARISRRELWEAYLVWCRRTGFEPESAVMFCRHLRSDGIGEVNGRRGREWVGLAIKGV